MLIRFEQCQPAAGYLSECLTVLFSKKPAESAGELAGELSGVFSSGELSGVFIWRF